MKTTYRTLIASTLLMCVSMLVNSQNASQNYVLTRTMLTETGSKYTDQVQYFDGLGRPFQTVQKGVTPAGSNLIDLQEYDAHGRATNTWLPVVSTSTYLAPATLKSQAPGNYASDARPYSYPTYEASPISRVTAQYGPGAAWNSKPLATAYNTNTTSGNFRCSRYKVSTAFALTRDTNYPAGTLFVTQTTDEDGKVAYTFADKEGRTVLIRQLDGSTLHDTYYVYDDFGNLCYVLPPMINDDITSGNLALYAYSYKYDSRNRCTEKKLPGCTAVKYVYDPADKLVFSQDGVQAAKSPAEWTFYLYDKYHRVVVEGVCTNTNTATVAASVVTTTFAASNTGVGSSGYTASYTLTSPTVQTVNYYDNYRFRSLTGFSNSNLQSDTVPSQGLLTGNASYILGTTTKLCAIYYYDNKGQPIKTLENNHLAGGFEKTTTTYSFTGKPLTVQQIHQATGKTTYTQLYTYTYNDPADRLTKVTLKLNTNTAITLADYTYDNFGRTKTKKLHGSATNQLTYDYNIRNWINSIAATRFTQNLYYNTGSGTACYNGNISSMTWKAGTETMTRGYKFTYDGLSRLKTATYGEGTTITPVAGTGRNYTTQYTYDKQGNMVTLKRYGKTTSAGVYGLIDNLTYTHTGNQIKKITDAAAHSTLQGLFQFVDDNNQQAQECFFDQNGNLNKDYNKQINIIRYNRLNLPTAVQFAGGNRIEYTYDSKGTKRAVKHRTALGTVSFPMSSTTELTQAQEASAVTTDYCGNVIYEAGVLKRILTSEGYITISGTTPTYYYYLKDHQGNNRVVINSAGTVNQTSHYYPFGGLFADGVTGSQPFLYNGKELDRMHGLDWYDYHARMMNGATGGFTTGDPLAEKYYSWSPYAYCMNNPVRFVDPDGKQVGIPPTAIPFILPPPPPYVPGRPVQKNMPTVNDMVKDLRNLINEEIKTSKLIFSIVFGTAALQIMNSSNDKIEESDTSTEAEKNTEEKSNDKKKVNPKREAREKGKEEREQHPASEKRAKDFGRSLGKSKGKDAQRKAHDAKEKGAPDRTLKQLKEDYNPENY